MSYSRAVPLSPSISLYHPIHHIHWASLRKRHCENWKAKHTGERRWNGVSSYFIYIMDKWIVYAIWWNETETVRVQTRAASAKGMQSLCSKYLDGMGTRDRELHKPRTKNGYKYIGKASKDEHETWNKSMEQVQVRKLLFCQRITANFCVNWHSSTIQ